MTANMENQRGSYYITAYHNRLLSALCAGDRIIQASFSKLPGSLQSSAQTSLPVGSILIGRVGQVAPNIQAAFVDLAPGVRGFLPFRNIVNPIYGSGTARDDLPVQGDLIVVQITRAAVKTKEAVLSTELTLSGRYAVLSRLDRSIHYSGKASQRQRDDMKAWIMEQTDAESAERQYGYIIRTNAFSLTDKAPIREEMTLLADTMDRICLIAPSRTLYSVLYEPHTDYLSALLDTDFRSIHRIVTDIPEVHACLQTYFSESKDRDALDRLSFFDSGKKVMSLLNLYKLGEQLEEAFSTRVWLKSGGYLVIEPTESLVAIDVNTGKYTGRSGAEDTFLKINLEAAEMIALQLRVRNLSGMILVDFINMKESAHKEMLLTRMRSLTADDPVHTSVIDMTPLGLVEITRKKIKKNLKEQYDETALHE